MKKPVVKPRQRPVARPIITISGEQLALLLENMPEQYRGLVREAVENKTPLSAHTLPAVKRYSVLRAFKKAREAIALPEIIFHDLTRATIA
ncbi:hypothetical protein [Dechloromonas sp. CZR5]|uniref:hypothetical protein n=1 Tax=Dechloromonas sp. CZR5 TaxID=2608630 RepID=UPI00123D88DA|nr:hypothetical protein [Dechloromonas sp. CZR5]